MIEDIERPPEWFDVWGYRPIGTFKLFSKDKEFSVYMRADGAHLIANYAFGKDYVFEPRGGNLISSLEP